LVARAWQELTVDLTAQTDYFVARGISVTPEWIASEKITLSLAVTRMTHNYVGSNPGQQLQQSRYDTITGGILSFVYVPTKTITLTISGGHEVRDSNFPQFHYDDNKADAAIMFRF
jgi:hypothetical protein